MLSKESTTLVVRYSATVAVAYFIPNRSVTILQYDSDTLDMLSSRKLSFPHCTPRYFEYNFCLTYLTRKEEYSSRLLRGHPIFLGLPTKGSWFSGATTGREGIKMVPFTSKDFTTLFKLTFSDRIICQARVMCHNKDTNTLLCFLN